MVVFHDCLNLLADAGLPEQSVKRHFYMLGKDDENKIKCGQYEHILRIASMLTPSSS